MRARRGPRGQERPLGGEHLLDGATQAGRQLHRLGGAARVAALVNGGEPARKELQPAAQARVEFVQPPLLQRVVGGQRARPRAAGAGIVEGRLHLDEETLVSGGGGIGQLGALGLSQRRVDAQELLDDLVGVLRPARRVRFQLDATSEQHPDAREQRRRSRQASPEQQPSGWPSKETHHRSIIGRSRDQAKSDRSGAAAEKQS